MSLPVAEVTLSSPAGYEQDYYAWIQEQAALLRMGRLAEIDVAHLAEEVESMGISERRELESRLKVLLQHLLKWQRQPDARSASWAGSIDAQRYQLAILLRQSPSLWRRMDEGIKFAYPAARRAAGRETDLPLSAFPETCPLTVEQIFDEDYWPD